MKTTAKLFDECLKTVPDDIKLELNMSFAIADKIDEILKQKKLNQKQFAKTMGKSEAEVSRWLGGTHNFTLRTIAKISDKLGVNLLNI
ncbi:MAG: helix-turn-helix transcriptional regulator [Bacteroides sp.]|nr:helix-turn-helix transcriptional regulator [Bacteroides sp.]MCM1086220.1 helix-turn-helix transcriptional regulator [Bacteroides sp.]